jgi:hypothetical protein
VGEGTRAIRAEALEILKQYLKAAQALPAHVRFSPATVNDVASVVEMILNLFEEDKHEQR